MKRISIRPFCSASFYAVYFFLCLTLNACNEPEDTSSQWRLDNTAAYEKIAAHPDWKKLDIENTKGPDGVYYRNLGEEGTSTGESPLQTASVTVNYVGKYYTGAEFDKGTQVSFNVAMVVRGFSVALQKMHVGDKWEVCMPYYLGYGASTYNSIPAYTTLFFEIELLKIVQYPK